MKPRDKIRSLMFELRKINKEAKPIQKRLDFLMKKRARIVDKINKARLGEFGV